MAQQGSIDKQKEITGDFYHGTLDSMDSSRKNLSKSLIGGSKSSKKATKQGAYK